jgi:nicotinamide-nucleotide amidase
VIAELICVGNEILTGLVENSNSGYLSRKLWAVGIPVRESTVVADQELAIRLVLEKALLNSDLIVITGGLGPTDDDLTREAVAAILKRTLKIDLGILQQLEKLFSDRGFVMTENNRKQAMIIDGSKVLKNERGTAPGAIIEEQGKILVLLPGPPYEMQEMFDNLVLPYICKYNSGNINLIRTLKCIGIGESMLEEKIKSSGIWNYLPLSYIARGLEVDLQIKGNGDYNTAMEQVCAAEQSIRKLLGNNIFGCDDETLPSVVAALLSSKNRSLAVAESCSGGLLSDMITDQPGSSKYYCGGIVAYSRDAKIKVLGLPEKILDEDGIISEKTALAMSDAVRAKFNSDYGIGITGIAGPESDDSGSPVGLIYIAVTCNENATCKHYTFGGGRKAIKERAAQLSLNTLRLMLLE